MAYGTAWNIILLFSKGVMDIYIYIYVYTKVSRHVSHQEKIVKEQTKNLLLLNNYYFTAQ